MAAKLVDQITAHAFSAASIAGLLIQYAKQGISLAHGGLARCPNGRSIGSQPIKEVIWQSRNQAIHWDERNFRPPVEQCFQKLQREIDPKYSAYATRSMAVDVVELFDWTDSGKFKADMLSLS